MKYFPYQKKFIITQTFLNPSGYYVSGYHLGIDLVGLEDKSVYAINDGKVVSAGLDGGYGNTVVIHQDDGLYCRYSHLESISVSNNQNVAAGQTVIGIEGKTGNVTGGKDPRHLDLRISKKPYHTDNIEDYLDPSDYLGFPNELYHVINPGGSPMSKIKNIIICKSQVDKRAAAYLADHLSCKIIDPDLLPAEVLDQVFENVYVVGSSVKPVSKSITIFGRDRYDTCRKVLDLISKTRG